MSLQTKTPYSFLPGPNKEALCAEYVGKSLCTLRTPAFIVDRSTFAENCGKMRLTAKEWGAAFRAHLKTHKVRTSYTGLRVIHFIIQDGGRH